MRPGLRAAALLVLLAHALASARAERVLFDDGRAESGWMLGTNSIGQSEEDEGACEATADAEAFNLGVHESFYLQRGSESEALLTGRDCVLLQFESCDRDLLESLTFRAKFAGDYGRHVLPEIPMDHYVLRQTERNATTDTTFLFPMSYLDSIWQSESFDRLIVKCGSADGCPLSLSYAAIIPTSEVEPTLRANLVGGGSEGGDAQQELPVLPAPPLSYWICGVFPFPWCPLPAPSPPAPAPVPLEPEDPDYDDDYDYYGGGGDDDDDDDGEEYDDREASFLRNARLESYSRPGPLGHTTRFVTVPRTYGLGTFRARVVVPAEAAGAAAERPVIVFGHGLGANSGQYLTKMRHFASHGFVVVAPETFNLFDGGDMLECIPWLASEAKNPASFLHGVVDPGRVGLAGHSMGGAGSLAAASRYGATGAVKAVAAIHPAPLVGFGFDQVQVPAFVSAGSIDVVTAPLPIKGTIYDSGLLRGPKIMAVLSGSGHMEPVDGIGFQRWTGYLTAWFASYLRSDLEASTLIWGLATPQSLQVNPQMTELYSYSGASLAMKKEVLASAETPAAAAGADFSLTGSIQNLLGLETQYQILYHAAEPLDALKVRPGTTPILFQGDSTAFEVEASVNETVPVPFPFYVIGNSKGTLTTYVAQVP